ncbi:hypothetical protein JG687_00011908, partial [Phytophthora cactorum]
MRLYHALLVTAVALLASNVSAGSTDCAMTPGEIVESAGGSAPKDSFDGFDSSNDSPIQQSSTTSSDVGASQEVSSASGSSPKDSFDGFDSSNDSPIQQSSTTSSDVGVSQEVSSASGSSPKDSFDGFDSSNDSPIQQSSTTSSDVGASQGSVPDSPIQQGSAPTDASFISSYSGPTPDFPDYGQATDTPVTQGSDVGTSQGVTSPSGSSPKDSFDGFDSSNDSPIQQSSTTSSDVGVSQEVSSASGSSPKDSFDGFDSSNDSPIQQSSTTSSDVGASQGSVPDSPIQQGSAPTDASFISSYSGPTPDFPDYGQATDTPVTQGSDVGASQETTPDSPIQQDSTTASGSQGPTTDAPVTQDSTTNSGVDASQASTSTSASASNADDIKQGVVIPAGPTDNDASQKTDVAGESDINFQTTQAPTATTAAPTAASSSSSGSSSDNSITPSTSTTTADNSKLCAKPRIQITDVDVGAAIEANEDEAALKLVAIAAIPGGGSRVAFQSGNNIIVRELDADDKLVTSSPAVKVPLHDFADIHADKNGFVILGTRDAEGGGTLNCGN